MKWLHSFYTRESVVVPNDSISISISQLSLGSYSGAISGFIVTLNRSSASFLCQIFRSKNSWKRFYHPWTCLFECIPIPFQFQSTILSHHHWGFYFYFICNLFMRSQSFVVNNSYLSSVVALCTGKDFMPNLFRFIKFLVLINTNTNKIDC